MSVHERFHYDTLDELLADARRLGIELPVVGDAAVLAQPAKFGRLTVPNRLAVQPMEGCDAKADGAPSPLVHRRYERFAAGGAGLIWLEATAVVPQGRANPRQLFLNEDTIGQFAELAERTRAAAEQAGGPAPVLVLQLTHSGRYSRPGPKPAPIIAHHSAVLDPRHNLPADYPLITDEELDALQDAYVAAARLAADAGFDAVDIKSCHRYLLSELLAGFTRENSRYGGSYENRTRMLRETVARVRQAVGDRIEVTCRLNVFDAIEYPFGWGVSRDDAMTMDLAEPIKLIGQLSAAGAGGVNVSIGNPYFNPHVNRPADWAIANWPGFPEHPLVGVGRLIAAARGIQQALPDVTVVGSGYSWLRHFFPPIAAGLVEAGWVTICGVGRGALAYPDFARDILTRGRMDRYRVCVSCSSCTQIMRDGGRSGCVVRDPAVYEPIYKQGRHRDPAVLRELADRCRRCADPNCQAHCPAGIDIPAFLSAVADGQFRDAYRVLRRANLLPEICGAVCPVEVQCQGHCIQGLLSDSPVPIAEVQRWVSEMAVREGWAALEAPAAETGRQVAIVGGGPAGLAAAARLIERGHRVTVIERSARPGGKAASLIPMARLPEAEAALEIQAIFDPVSGSRLEWRTNTALGPGYDLQDLLAEGFDAVLLAFGLGNTAGLGDPAGRPERVIDAAAFLAQLKANADHRVAGKVAVIGGGNSAIDAAVAAAQRGADDVYLLYRRDYSQMPAWPGERDAALHAGVHLVPFVQPVGFVTDGGRATGLTLRRTELGPTDRDGRRRPIELPDSDFAMSFDLIVEAVGETISPRSAEVLYNVQLTRSGCVTVDDQFMTSVPGVFAAGDLINGGTTVVQAISEGFKAADAIDRYVSRPAATVA